MIDLVAGHLQRKYHPNSKQKRIFLTRDYSVYRAINIEEERVAACKVVDLTPKTTDEERRTLRKEMKSHSRMQHPNVIEFYNAVIVEPNSNSPYYPAVYMLLEMAAGGDLFDKIGRCESIPYYTYYIKT